MNLTEMKKPPGIIKGWRSRAEKHLVYEKPEKDRFEITELFMATQAADQLELGIKF